MEMKSSSPSGADVRGGIGVKAVPPPHGTRSSRRGYILVVLSLGLVFILGVTGLAVDVGRMYIAKSEAQSYVDSAAFSAALQLDGTAAGLGRAQTAVANDPKKWDFQNDTFTGVTSFGTASTGPWVAPPNPATGYYFAQVQTTVKVPMYLMTALVGQSATVAASAVAGRAVTTGVPGGEFPALGESPDYAASPPQSPRQHGARRAAAAGPVRRGAVDLRAGPRCGGRSSRPDPNVRIEKALLPRFQAIIHQQGI